MPYTHFSRDERIALQAMTAMGLPVCYIAVIMGKHQSSVCRELARNSGGGVYTGEEAHRQAGRRRRDSKGSPKRGNPRQTEEIVKLFKEDYSPEQIAGRLRRDYPDQPEMWASVETIYQYLYGEVRKNPELKKHFRHPRVKRKGRGGAEDRRGQIPDRKLIDERPEEANKKVRAGDWEGDTIEGAGKTAYIATFVDRNMKLLLGRVMPNKAAATLNEAAVRAFQPVPAECLKTLTVDNGKEFSAHKALSGELRCDIYFAHPYHSWERGLNEHTNGLIRQYLPKGTSFDTLTQEELDRIVEKINNRPRKALGYRTPNEVFSERLLALQI